MEEKQQAAGKKSGSASRRTLLRFAFFIVFLFSFLVGYNSIVTQQNCGRAIDIGQIQDMLSGMSDITSSNDPLGGILNMAGINLPISSISDFTSFNNTNNNTTFNLPEFDADDDVVEVEVETCTPCTTYPGTVVLCDFVGTSQLAVKILLPGFEKKIRKVAKGWEDWLSDSIDGLVYHTLQRLQVLELDMISWWDTMWFYNLRPSMQAMLEQLHAGRAAQALQEAANADAAATAEAVGDLQEDELERIKVTEADENGCPAATVTGGTGRAIVAGNAVREALQNESLHAGYNKKGSPGALGRGAYLKHKSQVYEDIFCSPDSNDGNSGCNAGGADYPFFEADVQPSKFIFDKLTIPLDSTNISRPGMTDGEVYAQILQRGIENIVGSPSADVIPPSVVSTTAGEDIWMDRRSHLARYAAARGIPQLLVGWRTPGAGATVGAHVKEMRELVGVHESDISANPSYREMIHALTVDRFNSGRYALDQITDDVKVEQEKLRLATFTSILLRDYYELLERTALALAVQVAVMAEEIPYPDPTKARNQRRQ